MNKPFKISEKITYEYIDENIYILHIENGNYYKLSKSASLIWNEIKKGNCFKDIKTNMESQFGGNDKIGDDIEKALKNFIQLGFIEEN